jgi:site-specific DNA-methyltransferase (adenine-specific)
VSSCSNHYRTCKKRDSKTCSKTIAPFGRHQLIHGDSLQILSEMDDDSFDCFLTDPPYCAATRGSTSKQSTATKYTSSDAKRQFEPFVGDSRDQRSFTIWCSMWMTEAFRLTRAGGAMICFMDYRNLHCVVDAIQIAGWDFDGIIPWIKPRGRPRMGWFQTSRSEFVVCGRKGSNDREHRTCGPSWLQASAPTHRVHPTQKPVEIFTELIRFRPDWKRICDPFGGSATTILASEELDRDCTAIEKSPHYFAAACERLTLTLEPA